MLASCLTGFASGACASESLEIEPEQSALSLCSESGSPTVDVGVYPADIVDLVDGSDAIFRGVVTELGASTFDYPGFDLSKTIVVTLSSTFTEYEFPQDVTVEVNQISQFTVGQDAVFFVRSWVMGEGVGVVENAHLNTADYPSIDSAILAVQTFTEERDLHALITDSDMVLTASVNAIENFDVDVQSEHDPLWAEARLHVNRVACGASVPLTAAVRFSSSVDVAWFDAPKLASGDNALLLVQTDAITEIPGDAFVVVDSAEVRATSDLARVVDLLTSPPALDLSGL